MKTKIKIEIDIELDFEKYYNEIPEGLFQDEGDIDDNYKIETVYHILSKVHTNSLENHMRWLKESNYEYAKHHLLIDDEISKQISKNHKINIIK